ncbi:MAG TPA: hypothetical protein VJN89_17735 [Candidatus Acidoferrum sp.]|nr:hypothetical protein [Candidatus Acidoferrum sp.]
MSRSGQTRAAAFETKGSHRWLCLFVLLLSILPAASVSRGQSVTVTGKFELTDGTSARMKDLSNAVVWLTRLGDSAEVPPPRSRQLLQLVQKHKVFSPHVLVVRVGAPVEFPNRDPFFHNVFSLFEGKRFDLGLYEAGSTRTVVFDRPGISYIFCNIHAEMGAVVIALKTPYYGVSDRKGVITIPGVPAGRYEVRVWDERALPEDMEALTRTLDLSESAPSLGVFQFAEHRSALLNHKNKYGQDYENPTPTVPAYARP